MTAKLPQLSTGKSELLTAYATLCADLTIDTKASSCINLVTAFYREVFFNASL